MEGSLYLGTSHGCVALRTNDGSVLWQQELGPTTQIYSPPVVLNNTIYFSYSELRTEPSSLEPDEMRHREQALICALRASDGSLLWQQPLGGTASASRPTELALIDTILYVGTNDGMLSAYRSDDGTPIWHYQTNSTFLSSPTGTSGLVYIGANNGYIYALQTTDGTLQWQTFISTAVTSLASISLKASSKDF